MQREVLMNRYDNKKWQVNLLMAAFMSLVFILAFESGKLKDLSIGSARFSPNNSAFYPQFRFAINHRLVSSSSGPISQLGATEISSSEWTDLSSFQFHEKEQALFYYRGALDELDQKIDGMEKQIKTPNHLSKERDELENIKERFAIMRDCRQQLSRDFYELGAAQQYDWDMRSMQLLTTWKQLEFYW